MQVNVDVEAWLSAKLENPWSSERLASTLSVPTLQQIKSRFALLDTPIKLRLLFSFASLRKKLKDELEAEVRDLLTLSSEDDDEWVRVVSKMLEVLLQEGPNEEGASGGAGVRGDMGRNGSLSATLPHSRLESLARALNNEHFTDVIEQVRQRLEERPEPVRFYPLEFPFLNKELVPELPNTTEPHFRLKKPLEEPAPPPALLKRSTSKTGPFRGSATPDLSSTAEKASLSKSGGSHIPRTSSLGGSSPSLRNSSSGSAGGIGSTDRGIKRSLNASRGSLGGLSSSQKKLRVLDLDEVLGMERNQEAEKAKKKSAEEEQEKERRRKEKHDAAEAKRQEREEKKKKRNEELEKRKAKKEEEKAEKEAKRKERIAAQAQAKAQRKAAVAAAAASKKASSTSPDQSPEMSPNVDSPSTTPGQTPTFSPLASPFMPTPSSLQRPSGLASATAGLTGTLNAASGGIGMTVGGGVGALGSSGISTVPGGPAPYAASSLSSALHATGPSATQPGMKPYAYGVPGGAAGSAAPGYLQATRTGGPASSLLSQALHPSQSSSVPGAFPGQAPSQSLLSAFSTSSRPMAPQASQPPSSLLSAYMSQQPSHAGAGYGSTLGGLGGAPSMLPPYGQGAPQQPQAPAGAGLGVPGNLLDQANRLSDRDRQLLVAFLKGESPGQLPTHGIRQILLNEEEKLGEGGMRYLEQIIFEINYQSGSWRKLRRKKVIPTGAPTAAEPPKTEA